jgi:hypothetical protein
MQYDVINDVDHLDDKRIHLMSTSYIVIGDTLFLTP